MDKEKLKNVLEAVIKSNKTRKENNFERNKGLSGNSIATDYGKKMDAYYSGRIDAYTYVLKLLSEED